MSTTRRQFNTALLGSPVFLSRAHAGSADGPNILFILTDDQRWDQLGCAGHPFLKTPNMDRIAHEGAMFNNMFVTTSLCAPSRASFLTGRYAHAHGLKNNHYKISDAELRRAFPTLLRQAGYETSYFGKFHVGPVGELQSVFDYWAAFPGQGDYIDPEINFNGEAKHVKGYCGQIITDLALDWLKRPHQKPFCMTMGFKEPHGPFIPPDHLKNLYSDEKFELPPVTPEQLRGKPAEVRNMHKINPERFSETQRNYSRCITAADEQIGRILQFLDESKLSNNTVLVFAGDNGKCFGDFGIFDKRYGYETSLRVPMLVRYPKLIKPGTRIDAMALNIDLCPTLLDLAGQPIPKDVHGASWRPLFENKGNRWRDSFEYEHWRETTVPAPSLRGIRTSRYMYIEYTDTKDTPELYDLQTDPHEWNNLSDDPKHKPLMARLKSEMDRIESQTK